MTFSRIGQKNGVPVPILRATLRMHSCSSGEGNAGEDFRLCVDLTTCDFFLQLIQSLAVALTIFIMQATLLADQAIL